MNTINPISKTPPTDTVLLVYDIRHGWGVAVLYSYGWNLCVYSDDVFELNQVTHWMELPPNPLA